MACGYLFQRFILFLNQAQQLILTLPCQDGGSRCRGCKISASGLRCSNGGGVGCIYMNAQPTCPGSPRASTQIGWPLMGFLRPPPTHSVWQKPGSLSLGGRGRQICRNIDLCWAPGILGAITLIQPWDVGVVAFYRWGCEPRKCSDAYPPCNKGQSWGSCQHTAAPPQHPKVKCFSSPFFWRKLLCSLDMSLMVIQTHGVPCWGVPDSSLTPSPIFLVGSHGPLPGTVSSSPSLHRCHRDLLSMWP